VLVNGALHPIALNRLNRVKHALHGVFNIEAFVCGISGRIQFLAHGETEEGRQELCGVGVRKNTISWSASLSCSDSSRCSSRRAGLNYQAELSAAPSRQNHNRWRRVPSWSRGSAAVRRANRARQSARSRVAARCDPGRHLQLDRRTDRGRQAYRARLDRAQRADLRTKITGPDRRRRFPP